jgi:hypothetical protein
MMRTGNSYLELILGKGAKMEKLSFELIKFLPEVDLTDFKPYGNSKHILVLKRLRPEHALALQKALNRGTAAPAMAPHSNVRRFNFMRFVSALGLE